VARRRRVIDEDEPESLPPWLFWSAVVVIVAIILAGLVLFVGLLGWQERLTPMLRLTR